ncbi:hypothetical protein EBZ39_15025 [bacterium]|nr:hypothetical protein [bacterium]
MNKLIKPFYSSVLSLVEGFQERVVRLLSVCCLVALVCPALQARSMLATLNHMRDKVARALTNGAGKTFKELFHGKKGPQIFESADGVTSIATVPAADSSWAKAQAGMQGLFWAKQEAVANQLEQLAGQDKNAAREVLKAALVERYGAGKSSMLHFAKQLAAEETALQEILNDALRATKEVGKEQAATLKKLFDERTKAVATLTKLAGVVNALIEI